MGALELSVRLDWEAGQLRQLARCERDGRVTARLLAIANVLDGMSRKAAAQAPGMDRGGSKRRSNCGSPAVYVPRGRRSGAG